MQTAIHVIPEPLPTTTETRIAAYLLAEYLERLGVEVVFGLTGHTVIGMLDALGRSSIRYVSTRHEQVAATPRRVPRETESRSLLTTWAPLLRNAAPVAPRGARSPDVGSPATCSRTSTSASAPEINLPSSRQFQIFPVLQARVPRGHARDSAHHGARRSTSPVRSALGPCSSTCRWTCSPPPLPIERVQQVPRMLPPSIDEATAGTDLSLLVDAVTARPPTRAASCCRRAPGRARALSEASSFDRAHAHWQGRVRESSPLLLGMTGFFGRRSQNEKAGRRMSWPRVRDAAADANSEFVGSRFRDSRRHGDPMSRRRRDGRTSPPSSAWSPTEAGASALAASPGGRRHARGRTCARLAAAGARSRRTGRPSLDRPMRPERILADLRKRSRVRLHRHDVGEQDGVGPFPDHGAGYLIRRRLGRWASARAACA